jgi:hypothetical protein
MVYAMKQRRTWGTRIGGHLVWGYADWWAPGLVGTWIGGHLVCGTRSLRVAGKRAWCMLGANGFGVGRGRERWIA